MYALSEKWHSKLVAVLFIPDEKSFPEDSCTIDVDIAENWLDEMREERDKPGECA